MRLRIFESDIEGHVEPSLLSSVSLKDPRGAVKIGQGCDFEFFLPVSPPVKIKILWSHYKKWCR